MDYLELIKKEYNQNYLDYLTKYAFLSELFNFAVYDLDIEKSI